MAANFQFETMTMAEYKRRKEFDITFGVVPTPFGCCLMATHETKICHVSLLDEGDENASSSSAIDVLQREWPNARLQQQQDDVAHLAEAIFAKRVSNVHLLLRGTELQCNVWKQLTTLPVGSTASYAQIAAAVGRPRAVRAVATAIASNKIAILVPCHRVVRKTGALGNYRWGGVERKKRLLNAEKMQIQL